MDTFPPEFEQQLGGFLRLVGKQACAGPTREAFAQWCESALPAHLPAMVAQLPPDPQSRSRLLRLAAHSLYADLPLPSNGWVAPGPLRQERNAPCACGSGRKYKHCCGAAPAPQLFGRLNLMRYVLDAWPKSRLPELARSRAAVDAIGDTAYQWEQEGDAARAAALLEPFFKVPGPLGARLAPLFNHLMGAWLALGRPVKRERLIDEILLRGDKILRSDALQRRTTMLADRGDHAGAWRAFRQASALNPTDPALGFLEVTTLVSEGRLAEAQGRAQWWAASLARQRDPSLSEIIERLRDIARDPHGGLMGVSLQSNDHWRRLHDLFQSAPAPQVRHRFEVFSEKDAQDVVHQVAAELVPDAGLARLEALWRQRFAQTKPSLTRVQNDARGVWDKADPWLDLLQDNPDLWFSFDVLDDLVMAVDTMDVAGVLERLLVPMAERAVEQLRLTLASGGHGAVECHWSVWPNRPALRPVAHLAWVCKETGEWQRFTELAEWMVLELNPNDNHGLRTELSCAYVRAERWGDVLALERRYAGDMNPGLALNALLAAFVLGDDKGARDGLKHAARDYPTALQMLMERAPKPVAPDAVSGIHAGGRYEAWLYVGEMRPYWERHHALDWARSAVAAPKRRAPVAPSSQGGLF